MTTSSFVHLHLHTQYSLLDGAIKIPKLLSRAKDFGMPAVGITDHGNLFGAMEFYFESKNFNIKPIIGCEVYMAPGSRFSKQLPKGTGNLEDPFHHLTVICMDRTGYKNLCKLITLAHFEGFYYKPRIDKEILSQYHEGLIVLSGCLSSEISQAILFGQEQKATDLILWYQEVFRDRFYLEIQENKIPEQAKVNEALLRYGARFQIPIVGTNDCHYLYPEDAVAQEVLLCVQTGKTLQDSNRMKFGSHEFYFKSPEELSSVFSYYPKAVDTTLEIADRCKLDFETNKIYLPRFELPNEPDLDCYLEKCAREGLEAHLSTLPSSTDRKVYDERLHHELAIILKTGFAGYFLIVADFVNYARKNGIPVGPGRGSAVGSMVAFCLKITTIDPIPYHLIFERFLNPERISMPDMDIDFCMDRRDQVIHYVNEKYGKENVAQIITFGKMQAKAAIRDVGRVYGFPYSEVDRIAKLVPNVLNITLHDAMEQEPRLKDLYETDEKVKQLLNTALALEGLYRHASIHAAGIVISNKPLVEYMPLFRGKDGEVVTSFDMKNVEKIGLIKFDFLGLKTLTLIDHVVKKIREKEPEFDLDRISLNDKKVYDLFSQSDTVGIFQFESSGMRDVLLRLKPSRFEDIIAANALFRPGPMNMLDDFIDRRHNRVEVHYLLPELKEILQDTYGVILYQEQVMKIANVLANYSLGEADILRKAMGKKNVKEMAKQKERFLSGAKKNAMDVHKAEQIFDLMAKFAEYGFNKSHSTGYATVAYQTAYLKTYYPVYFMAEMLTMEMEDADKISRYIQDVKYHDICILPPDVHESYFEFKATPEGHIRFGLGAIKNVGSIAIDAIIESRKRVGPFKSLSHFCENVDQRKVNHKVLESLIKAGAFDSVHPNRAQLMEGLGQCIEAAQVAQSDREMGQYSMFQNDGFSQTQLLKVVSLPDVPEWPHKRKLRFEKESTGLYITGHPLYDCEEHIRRLATHDTESLIRAIPKSEVRLGGIVSGLRETVTKKGDKMAFVALEDLKGSVDVIVFSDLYLKVQDLLKSDEPCIVTGTAESTGETAKVIATQIESLAEVQKKRTHSVHLSFKTTELQVDQLQNLKFVLGQHQGNCPVFLHMFLVDKEEEIHTIVQLSDQTRVIPCDLLVKDIEKIFGKKVVRFE